MIKCRRFAFDNFLVRKHHVTCAYSKQIVLFGGVVRDTEKAHYVTCFNPSSGQCQRFSTLPTNDSQFPGSRSGSAATACTLHGDLLGQDSLTQGILLVGGWRGQRLRATENDVWFLALPSLVWHRPRSVGQVPGPCNFATLNLMGSKAVLFRGGDGTQHHNELSLYDLTTGTWTRSESVGPSPRSGHSTTVLDDEWLFLLGGWDGKDVLEDFWMWHIVTETWTEVILTSQSLRPGPRADAALSIVKGDLMVLFGGSSGRGNSGDPLLTARAPSCLGQCVVTWTRPDVELSCGDTLAGRVAHRAVVMADTVIITGGVTTNSSIFPSVDTLRLAGSGLYLHFDQQPGFPVHMTLIDSHTKGPPEAAVTLHRFACAENLADVRFEVQGVIFPAHRLALALSSRVFRKMFTGQLQEGRTTNVKRPIKPNTNVSPAVFEIFLRFCYGSDLPGSILRQSMTPWSGNFSNETHAAIVALVLARAFRHPDMSLRDPAADPVDTVRVKIGEPVPYAPEVVEECITLLTQLLQLADEFACTTLEALVPVVLGALVTPTTFSQLYQTALAFGSSPLREHLEWRQRHWDDCPELWPVHMTLDEESSTGTPRYPTPPRSGTPRHPSSSRFGTPPSRRFGSKFSASSTTRSSTHAPRSSETYPSRRSRLLRLSEEEEVVRTSRSQREETRSSRLSSFFSSSRHAHSDGEDSTSRRLMVRLKRRFRRS